MSPAATPIKSAAKPSAKLDPNPFDWDDPLLLDDELTDEERMVRDTARDYCQDKLMPRVLDAFRHETFDRAIMTEMGALGLLGSTLPEEYGCAGANYVAYGLVAREVERVDRGYRSAMSVQSSLVMHPIYAYGTEEQRMKYLPKLASGEFVGCFGLTEPDHGSDPGGMKTRAREGRRRLQAQRRQDVDHQLADRRRAGGLGEARRRHPRLHGRARHEGFLDAEDRGQVLPARLGDRRDRARRVCVPERTAAQRHGARRPVRLPQQRALRHRLGRDGRRRILLAAARNYTLDRKQFGRPLAANQLIQKKLADMQTEITLGLQAPAPRPAHGRRATPAGDDLADEAQQLRQGARHRARSPRHARRQRRVGRISRDPPCVNLEAVNTYEGTHDVHALILGRAMTGIQAFTAGPERALPPPATSRSSSPARWRPASSMASPAPAMRWWRWASGCGHVAGDRRAAGRLVRRRGPCPVAARRSGAACAGRACGRSSPPALSACRSARRCSIMCGRSR